MRKAGWFLLLLVSLLTPLSGSLQASPTAAASSPTVQRTLLSLPVTLDEREQAGEPFTFFDTQMSLVGDTGAPALPIVSELVGVPSLAAPTVTLSLGDGRALGRLRQPLEPMATYRPVRESEDQSQGHLEAEYHRDPARYAAAGWFPAEPVQVGEPRMWRGQAVVEITFTPVQVNFATGEVRWTPSAGVGLSWPEATLLPSGGAVADPEFEATFAATLSNYEQARAWRQPAAQAERAAMPEDTRWIITLRGKGLFALPLDALAAEGVDVSDPARLALFFGSGPTAQEQALWFYPGNNALYLINTREPGRWSQDIVYQLRVLPTPTARRMAESYSPPTQPTTITDVPFTTRREEDRVYKATNSSAESGDRWLWDSLFVHPTTAPSDSFSTTFDLPYHVAGTPATVFSDVGPEQGAFYFCNNVTVSVNNHAVARIWNDHSAFGRSLVVAGDDLLATGNRYEVRQAICPGTGVSTMDIAGFSVKYQRALIAQGDQLTFEGVAAAQNYQVSGFSHPGLIAFETSALNSPQLLAGAVVEGGNPWSLRFGRTRGNETYLVTTGPQAQAVRSITLYQDQGIRNDLRQTDYILITPPEFRQAVQPLADWRAQQGLTTRVVETTSIYNDFGEGITDPAAIRAFLEYAYQNWAAPQFSYVVLVGDATFDPFDILGTGERVWVPPVMAYKDLYLGEMPSDHPYITGLEAGTVPGSPAAEMPSAHIGRLPVNSAAETSALVQKLILYEQAPSAFNDWRRRMIFVSDKPDSAGDFYALSDHFTSDVPGGTGVIPDRALIRRAYLRYPNGPLQSEVAVRDQIAWEMNEGALLLQYVGHGSRNQWSVNGGVWSLDRPNTGSDLALLRPNTELPMSLPWTCSEGYYARPGNPGMSESMLRLPDRGIIASFAPLGWDVAVGHDLMADGFFNAMFHESQPTAQVGALTLAAKLKLLATPGWSRLNYTYILLGDPALRLAIHPCLNDQGLACQMDARFLLPIVGR